MSVRVGFGCLQSDAVFAQNLDLRACNRLARFDRHQKNVVAAGGAFLRENSDIGDEQEPAASHRRNWFLFNRVPTTRREKEQTAFAPAVIRLLQMLGEIER